MIWDADLYDSRHHFVTAHGNELLALLDAQPGERILDLGCGTGDHVAALRAAGVDAIGVDSSPAMIEQALTRHPGLPVSVADARDLDGGPFDGILSNAVLHWIPEAGQVAAALVRALRPGGRFVAEFGGAGNVAAIREGVAAQRTAPAAETWYFPTADEYSAVLRGAGFDVERAEIFDRPTRLDGDHGLANWVRMFGAHLLDGVPDPDDFLAELEDRLRPRLWRDGAWWADYRRLRVIARHPS